MPLPENFSEFEHLQDVLRRCVNELVKESFSEEIEDLDINTPESALKHACLHKDNDTGAMCNMRMMLFTLIRGEVDLTDKLYAQPILEHHRAVTFAPQIVVKMKETKESAKAAKRASAPARMQISFRLPFVDETTVTENQISQWRDKAKALFPTTYDHSLGLQSVSYKDDKIAVYWTSIKYQFKTEAVALIDKLLDFMEFIRTHSTSTYSKPITYVAKNLRKHEPEVESTQAEVINFTGLGEKHKIQKGFKGVKVYVYRVELHLHGRLVNKNLLLRYI